MTLTKTEKINNGLLLKANVEEFGSVRMVF